VSKLRKETACLLTSKIIAYSQVDRGWKCLTSACQTWICYELFSEHLTVVKQIVKHSPKLNATFTLPSSTETQNKFVANRCNEHLLSKFNKPGGNETVYTRCSMLIIAERIMKQQLVSSIIYIHYFVLASCGFTLPNSRKGGQDISQIFFPIGMTSSPPPQRPETETASVPGDSESTNCAPSEDWRSSTARARGEVKKWWLAVNGGRTMLVNVVEWGKSMLLFAW